MSDTNTLNRNIIIIDDHPLTVDGYKTLLLKINENKNANFRIAYNCKQAYNKIIHIKNNNETLHFAFVDISLPAYKEMKIDSGCELAKIIRTYFPDCKIIILSMHKEPVWVDQIIKGINPEGFIAKTDINPRNFSNIFLDIDENKTHYSRSILEALKAMKIKNIVWGEYDSKILQLLSQGMKTINIPNHLPLCLSAVEKRKASMKKQILFDTGSDKELIDEAKRLGLL
jgi:DNA-binding NarL/FixJ family response regulator